MDVIKLINEKQDWLEDKVRGIGKGKYARVIKMAVKPTDEEYSKTLLVTGIGLALIGFIGFVIVLLWEYVPRLVKWMW